MINVDKILESAGNKNRYQYFILIMAFCFWTTMDLISISLPYLEKTRIVQIYDNTTNTHYNSSLNYSLCEENNIFNKTIEVNGHSWVIEYDIECDKFKTGLIGSVSFLGVMLGAFLFQYIPDMLGRKNAIVISSIIYSFTIVLFYSANHMNYIYLLSFFAQIFSSICTLTSFMLSSEISDPSYRSFFGAIINSAFSFSGMTFISLYMIFNNWRLNFFLASFFNLIITLIFMLIAKESPRYFYANGDTDRMIQCGLEIAKFNKMEKEYERAVMKKEETLDSTTDETITLNYSDDSGKDKVKEKKYSVMSLLYYKSIRYTFLINCYLWFSTSGIYYGLSIYLKNLPGDIYVNGIFIYTSEIFSYVLSAWIINIPRYGRRGSIFFFELVSLFGYITLLTFNLSDFHTTCLSFVARFAISGVYNIIYTYTAEVYPTVLRAKGLGFNSICARLGGIIFPLLIELLGKQVIFIFCLLNFISVILCLWLPETYGKDSPEKINE
jgi:MFS family permease